MPAPPEESPPSLDRDDRTLGEAAHHAADLAPGLPPRCSGEGSRPVTASVDDLSSLTPAITCVGGRGVHDPDKLLEPATGG